MAANLSGCEQLATFDQYCRDHFPIQYTPAWFDLHDYIGGSDMGDLTLSGIPHVCAQKVSRSIEGITIADYRPWRSILEARIGRVRGSANRRPPSITIAPIRENPASFEFEEPVVADPAPSPLDTIRAHENSQAMMGWGTLFEPVLCNYLAQRMNLRIVARDITYITRNESGLDDPFRYSPDGAFIDENGQIVLLEMKNPYSYICPAWSQANNDQYVAPHLCPSHPEHVKPAYVAQMRGGMSVISHYHKLPIAYSYFAEAIIRRTQWTARGLVPTAHNVQRMAGVRDAPPLVQGVIGFYHREGPESRRNVIILNREQDNFLSHILTHLREGIDGTFDPLYFKDTSFADDSGTDEHPAHEFITRPQDLPRTHPNDESKRLIAYLHWAMLGIHTTRIPFDPNFFNDTLLNSARTVRRFIRELPPMSSAQKSELASHIKSYGNVSLSADQMLEIANQIVRR